MKTIRGCLAVVLLLVLTLIPAIWNLTSHDQEVVFASELGVLKGRVSDAGGRAVEGARIYVYSSSDVRKPADYISEGTDKEGMFSMILAPGKYWAIARLKKTEGYGPLMPGDRHSGEPAEVELASGAEFRMDFVVADLTEAIRMKTKERAGPVKISGRIMDEKGSPVSGAYAFANRDEKISRIPDFVSASTDSEGRYTLYVPRGRYFVGGAVTFPPGSNYFVSGQMTFEDDRGDLDLIRKGNEGQ